MTMALTGDNGSCGIDVYSVRLPKTPSESLLRNCLELLNDDEQRAAERYKVRSRQEQAIVSRALLRMALSRRLGRGPKSWRFETSPRGRPRLASGQGMVGVDFNISHCDECVACTIARNARVGVDVETRNRLRDIEEVASRFLSPSEANSLSRMSKEMTDTALLRIWTLKEALVKGIGFGMVLDFRAIDLPINQIVNELEFTSPSAKRWAFRAYESGPIHTVGLAYRAMQKCNVTFASQSAVSAMGAFELS